MINKALASPFDLFEQIFVISLPGADDRRKHIAQHLPSIGLNYFEFFDATQAKDPAVINAITSGEVKQYPPCFRCGGLDCGNPQCNNFLIPAQVATYLSYRRLWSRIVKGAANRILVLEDDVFFHSQTTRVLHWLAAEVKTGRLPFVAGRACLLRLGWARCDDHLASDALCRVDTSIKMANPCHALTRDYAAALLARDTDICHTVDVFQHQLAALPGEAFTVYPPIASELSWTEGVFESAIRPKKVHMDYLLSQGNAAGANAYLQQILIHVDKKYYRPLLIVGHPRCGTGYAASLCGQLGLDVGHEKLGKDGISSWMFAVEAERNPYALDDIARTRRAFAWQFLLMPVRDLGTAAASVMRDSQHAPPSYAFRQKYILQYLGIDLNLLDSPLEKAVWSVTSWARILLKQEPNLCWRIEDQAELMRDFLLTHKLCSSDHKATILDKSPVNANKLYQGRQYSKPLVSQNDWRKLSLITRKEIAWYCERFGYSLP